MYSTLECIEKKMKNAGGPNLTDKIGTKVKKVQKKVGRWKRKRNENGIVSLHDCKKKQKKFLVHLYVN